MYYIKNIIQVILSSIGGGLFALPQLTHQYPCSIFNSFIICIIFITIFSLLITKKESCFIIIEKILGLHFSYIIQYCYWFSSSCFVGIYINNIINTIVPNITNYSIFTVLFLKIYMFCFIIPICFFACAKISLLYQIHVRNYYYVIPIASFIS